MITIPIWLAIAVPLGCIAFGVVGIILVRGALGEHIARHEKPQTFMKG